jgi:hypothetical protein
MKNVVFCVPSGSFGHLDVRREGPLPIFVEVGFGSIAPVRSYWMQTFAAIFVGALVYAP